MIIFINGKQKRVQDGVDHDIQIIFHDASQTQMWIVEAVDDTLSLIVRTPDGRPAPGLSVRLVGGFGMNHHKLKRSARAVLFQRAGIDSQLSPDVHIRTIQRPRRSIKKS